MGHGRLVPSRVSITITADGAPPEDPATPTIFAPDQSPFVSHECATNPRCSRKMPWLTQESEPDASRVERTSAQEDAAALAVEHRKPPNSLGEHDSNRQAVSSGLTAR